MRVKSGRRVFNITGPQYTKYKKKGKKPVGAFNIKSRIDRIVSPPALRIMTPETFVRKTINVISAIRKYRRAKKFTDTSDFYSVPFGVKPEKKDFNLVEIELNADGRKFLKAMKILSPLAYNQAVYTMARGLRNSHTQVRYLGRRMIGIGTNAEHSIVPRDTGALRRDLMNSLSSRRCVYPSSINLNHNDLNLRIGFTSDLPYVDYLKKPFLYIKHEGKKLSRRTGMPLYDPNAKRDFMRIITNALRRVAMGHFYTMCRRAAPFLGIAPDYVKQMFTVKHIRGSLRTL